MFVAARKYIESVGGKLHGFWYAFGSHDGYNLVSMAAVAIAIGGGGALSKIETMPLLTVRRRVAQAGCRGGGNAVVSFFRCVRELRLTLPSRDDFEIARPIAKLRLLADHLEFEYAKDEEPWATARLLIRFRNALAHSLNTQPWPRKRRHLLSIVRPVWARWD